MSHRIYEENTHVIKLPKKCNVHYDYQNSTKSRNDKIKVKNIHFIPMNLVVRY